MNKDWALTQARDTFLSYAIQHKEKGKTEKATSNYLMALKMDWALTQMPTECDGEPDWEEYQDLVCVLLSSKRSQDFSICSDTARDTNVLVYAPIVSHCTRYVVSMCLISQGLQATTTTLSSCPSCMKPRVSGKVSAELFASTL